MSNNAFAYSEFETKPQDYNQNLWKVDHSGYQDSRRFINESSVYMESISEMGHAPLESAPVPRGMVKFAEWMCKKFGVGPSQFSGYTDIAHRVMTFMDYTEPYYLFVNSPVQIVPNQLKYTYRLKQTGSTLPPEQIEVFAIMPGWKFQAFSSCMALLEHPTTAAVLRGEYVKHSTRGNAVEVEDILTKISQLVWGDPGFINSWVDEWLDSFYMEVNPSVLDDELGMSLESFMQHDQKFWRIVALACLMWFRSEHALPFLCEYHPIYDAVLGWDKTKNQPFLHPGSGGEAIVYGWEVYNHLHVTAETNAPPGTCECCRNDLHCTKIVNARAVTHPVCSCGKAVDIMDLEFRQHGYGGLNACGPYRDQHSPVTAFACQRCLGMYVKKRSPEMACEHSPLCPNTQCQWHGGAGLYLRNLTERRRMLLTHQVAQ